LSNFVFFGTPHFSVLVLEELLRAGLKPVLVVTSPNKPVGRKQLLTPSPVKEFAMKNGLNVATPKNNEELIKTIQQHKLKKLFDFGILAAYSGILPLSKDVLNLFSHGILNIHPSLLPKYRGSTPLQTTILNEDAETGVTIIKLNEKIDAGDIVAREKMAIAPNDTTLSLGEKLFKLGAQLLIKILPNYLSNQITPISQILLISHSSLTKKFSKHDGFISKEDLKKALDGDKNLSAQIDRKFRAFQPWPGIWTLNSACKRVLITKCHLENGFLKIDWVKKEGENEEKYLQNL
jgi:methionyl-tRNA formyltransferase